jgi:cell filamentation protein
VTDGYLYPDGSQVLVNLLGIRDREALQRAEYRWAAYTAADALAYADRARTVSAVTWRGVHRRLFGDVYRWAGKFRTVSLAKGMTQFAPPRVLHNWADQEVLPAFALAALTSRNRREFAEGLAACWGELNFLHPFREGNGRSTQLLVTALARRHGHSIDWRSVAYEAEITAAKAAERKDYNPYTVILDSALISGQRGDPMHAYWPKVQAHKEG